MTKLDYTFKNDMLFKSLFVNEPELLKKLVAVLLDIKYDSISQFVIRNPEMPPDNVGDKFCRLDINMTIDGQRVDLEMQVRNEGAYPARTLFYWAREYSTAITEGEEFSKLPRTIVISIIDFTLFDCKEYHSEFAPLEVNRHTLLTDKMSLHYFELPKLPMDIKSGNILEIWLSLFKAETEEELAMVNAADLTEIKQAIDAYRRITVSPEFRERERLYSKARHDEAQARQYERQEGRREEKNEIAKILLRLGDPIEKVATATGLTREEIEGLSNKN